MALLRNEVFVVVVNRDEITWESFHFCDWCPWETGKLEPTRVMNLKAEARDPQVAYTSQVILNKHG